MSQSEIDGKFCFIEKLCCPEGVNMGTVPSLPNTTSALAYNLTDSKFYGNNGSAWSILGASENVTLAAIGAVPNANGASLAGQVLNLQPASASFGGVMTTGTQTIAGLKSFTSGLKVGTTTCIDIGSNTLPAGTVGAHCVNIGGNSGVNNATGYSNVAIGDSALELSTVATQCCAVGYQSLGKLTDLVNARDTAAYGQSSMLNTTSVYESTAIGQAALRSATVHYQNTALGCRALDTLLTGTGNIAIGAGSATLLAGAETNNIIVGHAGVLGDNNTTRIGTTQTKCLVAGIRGVTTVNADAIATLVDSAGQLGTVSSSRVLKENIAPLDSIMCKNIIKNLVPSTFSFKSDESHKMTYGLIAEDAAQVIPDLCIKIFPNDSDEEKAKLMTVQYHLLPILMLKEMQRMQEVIDQLSLKCGL